MNDKQKVTGKRVFEMIVGILLIGIGVAAYRLSFFGVDAFTCMNLGISSYIHMSFGNWQLIMNIAILIVVFFTVRQNIGMGTVINMVFVGYIADFLCWCYNDVANIPSNLAMRILLLIIGMFTVSLGAALYMEANLGISPYDSVAFIIQKLSKERVSFRLGRIMSDVTVMIIGIIFGLSSHMSIWELVGIGTVLNAFLNGPLIQFFRTALLKKNN